MAEFRLKDKFPDLQPISSAPSLFTMNGIGLGVYGRRDYDDETGTYVTTHCNCVIFVPVLALGAYRVADAPSGGYYFVGKSPISMFAKGWNMLLAAAVLVGLGSLGFQSWYMLPENVARRNLTKADRLVAQGEHGLAAALYQDLAVGGSGQATAARERLEKWLAAPPADAEAGDQHAVWKVAATLNEMGHWPAGSQPLHDQALNLAEKVAEQDGKLAVAILQKADPLDEQPQASAARKRKLLEKLQARSPGDLDLTVQLAQAVEQEGQLERCEALLSPLANQLAATEGARILGQLYLAKGKINEAHALLAPYCEARLAQFRAAESSFEGAFQTVQSATIAGLEKDPAFRRRYQNASEDERQQMVTEKITEAIKRDPQIARLRAELRQHSRVVPVALDFGVVQLYRAQGLSDPAERKAELERAEATFLAIGNAIGDSDEYKLNLAKVDYWLGKSAEGKKLLDEILERNAGDFKIRLAVVKTLREVGAETEARDQAEKLYNEESSEDNRYEAAELRALLFKDIDDEIEWLNRGRLSDPSVKASLTLARGNKAMIDGDDRAAEQELRQAAELYAGFPEATSSLNNAALCYSSLFHVRGDVTDLQQAARMLEKAVSLKPDDSVLMINAAELQYDLALAEVCGDEIDLRLIHMSGRSGLLGYLYRDGAGRSQAIARLSGRPALAKAKQYYEKAMLLAPKRATNYRQAAGIHSLLEDEAALQRLLRQIQSVQPDTQESVAQTLKFLSGAEDEKVTQAINNALSAGRKLAQHWQAAPPGDKPTSNKRSRSLAAAQVTVCGTLIRKATSPLDTPADPDEIVRLAEEALASHACSMTDQALVGALLYRVHAQLVTGNPEYRAFSEAYRRHLTPYETLLAGLDRESFRTRLVAHGDFQRALTITREQAKQFPKSAAPDDWMLARYADPALADQIAQRIRTDAVGRLDAQIDLALEPANGHNVLGESWRMQSESKPAEAAALFQRLNNLGVAWPQP